MDNILLIAQDNTLYWLVFWVILGLIIIGGGIAALMIKCLRKVPQGSAIIRNGMGGTKVSFDRDIVIPILHIVEAMDISVKRIEIDRSGEDGLICKEIFVPTSRSLSLFASTKKPKTSNALLSSWGVPVPRMK